MKLNQAGFSLMEVMVSVGLRGALSYVMVQQSEMSAKQQAKATFNQQVNSMASAIQTKLSRSENCSATLAGKTYGTAAAPTVINEIRRGRLDLTAVPKPKVVDNCLLLKARAENSNGTYIDSMHLIRQPGDNRKVLRVLFMPGSICLPG